MSTRERKDYRPAVSGVEFTFDDGSGPRLAFISRSGLEYLAEMNLAEPMPEPGTSVLDLFGPEGATILRIASDLVPAGPDRFEITPDMLADRLAANTKRRL